eukprot:CAMPEP_0184864786 /NCGR_PEP_ID=MMETSP0580-20130426/16089_1 /TAXON_ID=1118495 /ORGANISM="Dactyliosolen fragilissimus" /LENGTH=271 /DNA_ID=CAMNT_0027363705 /DNA_START=343 /DNA_END=1155 /DNA_ORIENTATION=-
MIFMESSSSSSLSSSPLYQSHDNIIKNRNFLRIRNKRMNLPRVYKNNSSSSRSCYGYVRSSLKSSSGESLEEGKEEEETLMKISLSLHSPPQNDNENHNHHSNEPLLQSAVHEIQSFLHSFPFASVLPVQPLTYRPNTDNNNNNNNKDPKNGLQLRFLRKKTKEKGSFDGGIDFDITIVDDIQRNDNNIHKNDDDNNDDDKLRIEIIAKRCSKGQTVPKMFSEKIVIQEFVRRLKDDIHHYNANFDDNEEETVTSSNLSQLVSITSLFHKW